MTKDMLTLSLLVPPPSASAATFSLRLLRRRCVFTASRKTLPSIGHWNDGSGLLRIQPRSDESNRDRRRQRRIIGSLGRRASRTIGTLTLGSLRAYT